MALVQDILKGSSRKPSPNTSPNIRVRISSRSKQPFAYKRETRLFSEIREDLTALIKTEPLFDDPLFEPWINEPAAASPNDVWDECMARVQRTDILIAIYSGDAGWAKESREIGICHAELEKGLNSAHEKVRILQVDPLAPLRRGLMANAISYSETSCNDSNRSPEPRARPVKN